jgi:hypothetical protein
MVEPITAEAQRRRDTKMFSASLQFKEENINNSNNFYEHDFRNRTLIH